MSVQIDNKPRSSAANLKAPGAVVREEGEGGKGGNSLTLPTVTNAAFLSALFGFLKGAIALICGKAGDPGSGGWLPQVAAEVDEHCPANVNTYFNCASFRLAQDGTLSARKENIDAYHVLVLDDVGSKVAWGAMPDVPSTFQIETSPGNFQVGYKLTRPINDPDLVEAAQRAIFGAGLGDKGAGGMSRWMRLPIGINGKPKHRGDTGKPFQCMLTQWNPDVSYELEDLVRLLAPASPLPAPRTSSSPRATPAAQAQMLISPEVYTPAAAENPVVTALKVGGLYKDDLGGGQHNMTCPWCHEHTDQIDNGACFFEATSGYPLGGFKCHHGHCADRKLSDLLKHLDLNRGHVRNVPCIRSVPGELPAMVEAAQLVLAQTGEFFQLNGTIVRVQRDCYGRYQLRQQSDTDLTMALANLIEWQYFKEKGSTWQRGHPHKETIRLLAQLREFHYLPPLRAMAWQPVLDEDGKLLFEAGYDANSGLYLAFEPSAYALPERTPVPR